MNIKETYTRIEAHLARGNNMSEKRVYKQLLSALDDLQSRDMSRQQRESVDESLDRLDPANLDRLTARELKKRANLFLKQVRNIFSLIPEGYYMSLALCCGAAFGSVIGSTMQGFAGIPEGTPGTGLGIALGLILAYLIGSYLDSEAIRQNRVLQTQAK